MYGINSLSMPWEWRPIGILVIAVFDFRIGDLLPVKETPSRQRTRFRFHPCQRYEENTNNAYWNTEEKAENQVFQVEASDREVDEKKAQPELRDYIS